MRIRSVFAIFALTSIGLSVLPEDVSAGPLPPHRKIETQRHFGLPPPRPADLTMAHTEEDFSRFMETFMNEAVAAGLPRTFVRAALADLTPDERILALLSNQSEFVVPVWTYLDRATTPDRVERGKRAHEDNRDLVSRIEAHYRVPASILLGIWGMETNFGSFMGSNDVLRSLATLAFESHRRAFFRSELLEALHLAHESAIAREALIGSWAGALGHTQFMPSSYRRFAVDFDGDGRADLMGSIADALASSAVYLVTFGWEEDLPWGIEVFLPTDFDFKTEMATWQEWREMGVASTAASGLPDNAQARLHLPAGAQGPAFVVTRNFDVIKRYNNSDSYGLAVAILGSLVTSGEGVVAQWPVETRLLDVEERKEMQNRLAHLGLYEGAIDGIIGSKSRTALRAFQLAHDLVADGFASENALIDLRRATRDLD